jgi:YD repeat-containing protein
MAAEPLSTLAPQWRTTLPDAARVVQWSASGLVTGSVDGSVARHIVDPAVGHNRTVIATTSGAVTCLTASSSVVAAGDTCGVITVMTDGSEPTMSPHGPPVMACVHVDEAVVGIAGDRLIDATGSTLVATTPAGRLRTLTPSGVTSTDLLVGGTDGLAWIDLASRRVRQHLTLSAVMACAVDPTGCLAAAGDLSGSLHLVHHEDAEGTELTGYPDRVNLIAWTASGKWVAAAAADEITLWGSDSTTDTADEPLLLQGHEQSVTAMVAHPTHDLLVSGDADGVIALWSPGIADRPICINRTDGAVLAMQWDRDHQRLAITTSTGHVMVTVLALGALA